MPHYDVIIIGAGAAGMMCAIEAGKRGKNVLILDHARNPGDKIRISGGGRCNFTNLNIRQNCFLSQNPRFALSALNRYTQHDFIKLVKSYDIAFHEKTLGQLFCDISSKQIIEMLVTEMNKAGVTLKLNSQIENISYTDCYHVSTNTSVLTARSIVIATGGKSIPKMGATGFGYQVAQQFGIDIVETRPALVPLTFSNDDKALFSPLSGISVSSSVSCNNTAFDEGLLFTHRGLSGPSILQISSYWREGDSLIIDLARSDDLSEKLKSMRQSHGKQQIGNVLAKLLPAKLAHIIIKQIGLTGNLADQSNAKLDALGKQIHALNLKPVGSEGYRTAEVTLGGVNTNALNPKTMEAKKQAKLYFIGEVVDVTGWLGGYNFQWAWSSGWACGQAL